MSYHFIKSLSESKSDRELIQDKLKFDRTDLEPVISEAALKYHYDGLASKYFERYNAGEGDADFNYGGAVLHNLYFGNLRDPAAANKPTGQSKSLIDDKYGDFDKFKDDIEKAAMAIQGSGWIYMDANSDIQVIANHEYKSSMKIVLLIDWWEHSWALDYQQDKAGYLKNIWRIVDWEVVNIRLGV